MAIRIKPLDEPLSRKQELFISFYIKTANATESALKAGYSKKTSKDIGTQNLAKLNLHIKELTKSKDEENIADENEVLSYLTSVMRGKVKEEKPMVLDGQIEIVGTKAKVSDRNKAAELLGKRYRLFVDKIEVNDTTNLGDVLDELIK